MLFSSPGVARETLSNATPWLIVFLVVVVCMLPVLAYRLVMQTYFPEYVDKVGGSVLHITSREYIFFFYRFSDSKSHIRKKPRKHQNQDLEILRGSKIN